jgi:serine/threonine-protein kinase
VDPDGSLYGTPAYLAPERLVNDVIVAATDVYALGLLLYLCLTSQLPWNADTPTQMIRNHQYEAPAPLPKIDGLPASVSELCAACLAKNPSRRPGAIEAARTLMAADTGTGSETERGDAPRQRALLAGGAASSGFPVMRSRRFTARQRVLIGAVATAGVVIVAGGLATQLANADRGSASRSKDSAGDATTSCGVTFIIRPLGNGVFTAEISLVNNGPRSVAHWSLRFVFQGYERIVAARGASWAQDGTTATLTGGGRLASGAAVSIAIDGTGGSREFGPPSRFALNGSTCVAGYGPPPPPPPGGSGPPPPLGGSWPPPPG